MNNDKVYRVVVVKQNRCRFSTTLRKFEEAVALAGLAYPLVFDTRPEAEEALDAIETHASHDLVIKVEHSPRVRTY